MRNLLFKMGELPSQLTHLIKMYNQIDEMNDLERLFYLQKINYFMEKEYPNPAVIEWRNQLGPGGLEAHLQFYGIHRDASPLLQNIEFARAVDRYSGEKPAKPPIPLLFSALKTRKELVQQELSESALNAYKEANRAIMAHYKTDTILREKIERLEKFVALSTAKHTAVLELAQLKLNEDLSRDSKKPNQTTTRFLFSVDGAETPFTICLLRGGQSGQEQDLYAHEVSDYFGEELATLRVPFRVAEETIDYQVVITEFTEEVDLAHFARKIAGQSPDEIIMNAQALFTKINDFCLKLLDSGHYLPNMKLAAFLTDGEQIIIRDRHTLTDELSAQTPGINSSPTFTTPEAREQKMKQKMSSHLSFQLGLALKEFIFRSQLMASNKNDPEEMSNRFRTWGPIVDYAKQPISNSIKNISVLIQELTRRVAQDRLSIQNVQKLLPKINLSPELFLTELETISPKAQLSSTKSIDLAQQILGANPVTEEMVLSLSKIAKIEEVVQDPRATDLAGLISTAHLDKVEGYLKSIDKEKVDALLLQSDRANAGILDTLLDVFRFRRVPKVSTIEDVVAELPPIDPTTKAYLILATATKRMVQGFETLQETLCRTYFKEAQVIAETLEVTNQLEEKKLGEKENPRVATKPTDRLDSDLPLEAPPTLAKKDPTKPPQTPSDSAQAIKKALLGARADEPQSGTQKGISK